MADNRLEAPQVPTAAVLVFNSPFGFFHCADCQELSGKDSKSHTCIMTAHQLSTIQKADKIAVVKSARL